MNRLFFYLIVLSQTALAQERKMKLGFETQWYPAGWIFGPTSEISIRPQHQLFIKLGFNLADRHDWSGLNDNEEGYGFGGSLGYRYYIQPKAKSHFFVGTRGELYNTYINWQNDLGSPNETNGTTQIFVYQPSFELGCRWNVQPKWYMVLSGGAGIEINLLTKGKPVGEGGMWLVTFGIFRKLAK